MPEPIPASVLSHFNLRKLIPFAVSGATGAAVSHYKEQGELAWFPDWGFDVVLFVTLLLGVYWLWTQPDLRSALRMIYNRRPQMLTPLLIIVGLLVGGSLGAFGAWRIKRYWHQSEFAVIAATSVAEYPPGTVIGQIPWSPRFTDLRVSIFNNSLTDWHDIDLTLRPDVSVAAIGQITNVPDVSFSVAADQTMRQELVIGSSGKRVVNPLVLIASTGGYRVQCKKLARQGRIEIVMAIAEIPEFDKPPQPQQPRPDFGVFDRDYVLRLNSTKSSDWYGHGSDENGRIEEVFAERRPVPRTVQLEGRYSTPQGEQTVSQRLDVRDFIGDAIPQIRKEIEAGKDASPIPQQQPTKQPDRN
jgi:hypothetical protein